MQILVDQNEAQLLLFPAFLPYEVQSRYFSSLFKDISWDYEWIVVFGKRRRVPRKVCWYGDEGANYRYSGVEHEAMPWLPALQYLKQLLSDTLEKPFNSVLANLYRHGADSMGWHSDDEKELGQNPCIASVSLGATRRFRIQHKKTKESFGYDLQPGSLLVMQGAFQHQWRHCVPKTKQQVQPRINLTYRNIVC